MAPKLKEQNHGNEKITLLRVMGTASGILFVIGNMIGSGIFVSPKGITRQVHSVGASLVIWLACGIDAIMGAWAHAELGTLFRESGGNYVYFRNAFGAPVAYIPIWLSLLNAPATMATFCMIISEYLLALIINDDCEIPWIINKLLPVVILVAVYSINIHSFQLANRVQSACTSWKLLPMIVIIIGGIYRLAIGHTDNFQSAFAGTETNPGQIAVAFYGGLFAYSGGGSIVSVTEEIKNPGRVIPRALFGGNMIVICIYMFVNVSYFTVMTPKELVASEAVAVTWARTVIPSFAWFISISIAISTFGTAVANCMTAPRSLFASARNGELPGVISMIHTSRRTPVFVLLYMMCVSIALVFVAEVWILINASGFIGQISSILTAISIFVFRRTMPNAPRAVRVPLIIPVINILLSIMIFSLLIFLSKDKMLYTYAVIYVAMALPIYFIFVFKEFSFPGVEWLTVRLQMALGLVPTEDEFSRLKRSEIIQSVGYNNPDSPQPNTALRGRNLASMDGPAPESESRVLQGTQL